MSGASIPYHLRPHKAVDRRIFMDLLGRIERWRPLTDYVYLSMGAYPLEDHKLVHRILGVTKLIAFDYDDAIVARQLFNRPIAGCHCIKRKSGELIDGLDKALEECGFGADAGVIMWLDYTEPKKLGEQIREFQALLDKLRAGDIVRVTVNAHPHELIERPTDRPLPVEERRASQFDSLKNRIGDFMPSWASKDDMTADGLPRVISESFARAVHSAFPVGSANTFSPLSIVRYADGLQMLSVTGVVAARADEDQMRTQIDMKSWAFASKHWSDIHNLVVVDLTLRERLFLEREVVNKSAEDIITGLGFDTASGVAISTFIDNYKNYYRFYPTLLAAEV